MFAGRVHELEKLKNFYRTKNSNLLVVYGRRRIGKSSLIEEFAKSKPFLRLEGLEHEETASQIRQATHDLLRQLRDPILKSVKFETWEALLDYLSEYLRREAAKQGQKRIIFLDEFQWLGAGQSKLVSLIKKYWDQEWKKYHVMLVLCGSISSYMVKKVIRSKALYGRVDWELNLRPLSPSEANLLLKSKRSLDEVFLYQLIFGGIPKYLEQINPQRSLRQNLDHLLFDAASPFFNEYEKVFYSQFKEHRIYEKIVRFIAHHPKTLGQIADHLQMPSGGGIKYYLENLEKTLFISCYTPFDKMGKTKLIKYRLTDEYLRFYFKYLKPNLRLIEQAKGKDLFSRLTQGSLEKWLGFAFENFCLKNALFLAEKMGFDEKIIHYGPVFSRADEGFQVDLVYLRSDQTITLCEMKFHHKQIETSVIPEVRRKCELIHLPKGYTLERALISRHGPSPALKDADFFHHYLDVKEFILKP